MKNLFPFWMFPSRSLPFWAKTMAEHPGIAAMYMKLKRVSETQRYQAGAVDSRGRPVASLDGYIKLPGSDLWFNPLAPFSFRYLLDITKFADATRYILPPDEETLTGLPYLVKEMLTSAPIIGLNFSPWATMLLRGTFGIPEEELAQWGLFPQFSLIPRWQIKQYVDEDTYSQTMIGKYLFPEPKWQDALIENRILQDFYDASREMKKADYDREYAEVILALKEREGNPLWDKTYKQLTESEADRNMISFFSGVYQKTFSDGQADIIALKLHNKALLDAMNNPLTAAAMGMSLVDADKYEWYMDKFRLRHPPVQ
jgi:hypothetical protein